MEKRLSSVIIDSLVCVLSVFAISFLWIRYYEHNTLLIVLASIGTTFLVCSLIYFFKRRKHKKEAISIKENKQMTAISNYLLFLTKTECVNIFENCLKYRKISYVKQKDYLLFDEKLIYPVYFKSKVDEDILVEIIVKFKTKKAAFKSLIICAKNFTDEAKKLASSYTNFSILLFDEKQTYLTFFKNNPNIIDIKSEIKTKKSIKQKFKDFLYVAFNKNRFKGYLFSAIILLISSYFMRYNLYYLICSSILFIFALFSYFNKPFNPVQKNIFGE